MTKADILRLLERVPMNAPVLFVAEPAPSCWSTLEIEHDIGAAFTVTGTNGLTVLLTDGRVPTGEEYADLESV